MGVYYEDILRNSKEEMYLSATFKTLQRGGIKSSSMLLVSSFTKPKATSSTQSPGQRPSKCWPVWQGHMVKVGNLFIKIFLRED